MSGGKITGNKAAMCGGGVYGYFEWIGGIISDNTAFRGKDIYPESSGESSDTDNESLNNEGSSDGSNETSDGSNETLIVGGFSLRDFVFIGVGVAVVVVGVIVAVLLFSFKKELAFTKDVRDMSTAGS